MSMQKQKMSREDMSELYRDLRKTLGTMKQSGAKSEPLPSGFIGELVKGIRAGLQNDDRKTQKAGAKPPTTSKSGGSGEPRAMPRSIGDLDAGVPALDLRARSGRTTALSLILMLAVTKIALSAVEYSGITSVTRAEATIAMQAQRSLATSDQPFSKDEVEVLKKLDLRRVELDERAKMLEARQRELQTRDSEYAARMTQLKDLTERLKLERDKDQKKRTTQLDQLANVYSSMNPQEAAQLMQQLDVTIALSLLERMPEKRIGQILALMQPEKALTLTRMLSAR